MAGISYLSLFVTFLSLAIGLGASDPLWNSQVQPDEGDPVAHRLVAGSISSTLELRDGSLHMRNEAGFYVVQNSAGRHSTPMGGRVSVQADSPILLLEEVEQDLDEVHCQESTISLSFNSLQAFTLARSVIQQFPKFLVVTAHEGCNEDGERAPYWVTNTTFDETTLVAVLRKSDIAWRDAFHTTTVHFGSGEDWSHVSCHEHSVLRKRQSQTSDAGSVPTTSISFPTVAPSASAVSTINEQINKQLLNTQIMPPQIPVANQFIPQNVITSCKNCTISGNIEISQGSFAITTDGGFLQDVDNTIAFFEHGSIEFVAHNLFAHIELDTKLSASVEAIEFRPSLPSIGITPIQIPGVAVLGPLIQPDIIFSITLAESIDFTYGFDVSIPDGSTFIINMTDVGSSTMKGFDQPTVNTLPFQAGIPIPSLIFSMTLSPQFLLGISGPAGTITGGLGAFFDMPQVSINVTQLSGVNGKCETPDDTPQKIDSALAKAFDGNLTNIVPSVNANFGGVAEFEVQVPPYRKLEATSITIASTSFPLPTACLNFDSDRKTYGPVPASATETGAVNKKSAGSVYANPLSGIGKSCWALLSMCGMTLIMVAFY